MLAIVAATAVTAVLLRADDRHHAREVTRQTVRHADSVLEQTTSPPLRELQQVAERLSSMGALVGASDHGTTKALYAHDPDGIEFEVSWLVPADRIDDAVLAAKATTKRLDLAAEIGRYGADTPGLHTVAYA